jgi:parvulin-like peptidyl-prolyl isomerase
VSGLRRIINVSITKFRKSLGHLFKWPLLLLVGIFLASCFTWYGSNMFDKKDDAGNAGWLAKVNGEKIAREPFDKGMQDWSQRLENTRKMGPTSAEMAAYVSQSLSQAIVREALRQAADKQGIRISGREVDEAIDKRVKDEMASARQMVEARLTKANRKPTRSDVDKELEAMIRVQNQNDSATIESFEQDMRNGIDRDELETQLAIQKLGDNLTRSVKMTERELIDSYRQVSVSRILIKPQPNDAIAQNKAKNVLAELKAGDDFAKLARDNSDDPMTKEKGGAFPFPLTIGMAQGMRLDPALTRAIFALPVGTPSNVIHTADGYEIVKVTAEKSTLPKNFQQQKKQYMDQALQAKRSQASSEFYQKIMKDAKVEVPSGDLRGYWLKQQAMEAGQAGKFDDYTKILKKAIPEFKAALVSDNRNAGAVITLAQIYQTLGQPKEAIQLLETKIERRETRTVEDAPLHILLGDLYAANKKTDLAIAQYGIASMVGIADESAHQQLVDKFKQVGRPDLAAKEKAFVDQAQAMRSGGAVRPTSAPAPAPGG